MDKYEVKKIVGEGSYGKALLCGRKVDRKLCIIKQISIGKLSKKEQKMTQQEADLLKNLHHPNIVQFWDSFFTGNNLYIVMEFADGGDLDTYIKNHQKRNMGREMPEAQVLNLFVQLCLAIKHIHDRKILHRDLKSQNVFLTSSGLCKVGDFGVSRVLRSTMELASTQIGTPYYMSPEIMNNQRYNSKTDIWSLGIILYELVCLRLPFQGNSMRQLCQNIISGTPAPPSTRYSAELRDLVMKILAKDQRVRPGINNILARPIMKSRIKDFLNETKIETEFNHTILHGVNVLQPPKPAVLAMARPTPNAAVPTPSSYAQVNRIAQPQVQPQIRASPLAAIAERIAAKPSAAPHPLPQGPPPAGMKKPAPEVIKIPVAEPSKPALKPPPVVHAVPSSAARLRVQMKPAIPTQQQPSARPSSQQQQHPQNARPSSQQQQIQQRIQQLEREKQQLLQQKQKQQQEAALKIQRAGAPPAAGLPSQPSAGARAAPVVMNNRGPEERRKSYPDVISIDNNNHNNANPFAQIVGSKNVRNSNQEDVAVAPMAIVGGKARTPSSAVAAKPTSVPVAAAGKPSVPVDSRVASASPSISRPAVVAASDVRTPQPSYADGGNFPVQFKRAVGSEDRQRGLDSAMSKVAEMMQNLKQHQQDRSPIYSPPPVSAPASVPSAAAVIPASRAPPRSILAAAAEHALQQHAKPVPRNLAPSPSVASVVSRPEQPLSAVNNDHKAAQQQSWLSDLQSQMGALKQQMQHLQANNKSPVPVDAAVLSPPPASSQAPSVAPSAVAVNKRQSFPIDLRKPNPVKAVMAPSNPAAAPSVQRRVGGAGGGMVPSQGGVDAPRSIASVASSVASKKKVGGRLSSDGKAPSQAQLQQQKIAKKPTAPSPVPAPAVDLEQRRELREKHKMGFKDFLRAQRKVNGLQEPSVESLEELQVGSNLENTMTTAMTPISSRATPPIYLPPAEAQHYGSDPSSVDSSPVPSRTPRSMQPSSSQSKLQSVQQQPPKIQTSQSVESSVVSAQPSVVSVASSQASQGKTPAVSVERSHDLRKFIEEQKRKKQQQQQQMRSPRLGVELGGGVSPAVSVDQPWSSIASTDTEAVVDPSSAWIDGEMFVYVKGTNPHTKQQQASPNKSRRQSEPITYQSTLDLRAIQGEGFSANEDNDGLSVVTPMRDNRLANEGEKEEDMPTYPQAARQPWQPVDSEEVVEPMNMLEDLDEDANALPQRAEDPNEASYLGKSFVTELHSAEAQAMRLELDAQAALEYSLMLQQMQEILALQSHQARVLDAENYKTSRDKTDDVLAPIVEEDEVIEEGFEEAAFTFYLSDSDDEAAADSDGDVNEEGEEYLKEIADGYEEDLQPEGGVADDVVPLQADEEQEDVAVEDDHLLAPPAEIPVGTGEMLFTRTNPQAIPLPILSGTAALGRPPKPTLDQQQPLSHPSREDPFTETTRDFLSATPQVVSHAMRTQPTTSVVTERHADFEIEEDVGSHGGDEIVEVEANDAQTRQETLQKLLNILGADTLQRGLDFLSSAYLEDEAQDEEHLLNMLEAIVGVEHLYCLEDMYYLVSSGA